MNPVLVGEWKGISSTVPDYRAELDFVRISSTGIFEHYMPGLNGKIYRSVFISKSSESNYTLFPRIGMTENYSEHGLDLRIEILNDYEFKIIRVGFETLYRKNR